MAQVLNTTTRFGLSAQSMPKPPVLRGAIRLEELEPPTQSANPVNLAGPQTDQFEKTPPVNAPQQAASDALQLLQDNTGRKANALALYQAVTGVKPMPITTQQPTEPSIDSQDRIQALAQSLQKMSAAEKLDWVRHVTGPESPHSKVAESILVNQNMPSLKELYNCVKPTQAVRSLENLSAGVQGAALGMLALSLVAPTSLLFRPELLGQVAAGVAATFL